ncbi:MAG: class I SAM-dependent methyltransferase [Planctomycetota bacterium]
MTHAAHDSTNRFSNRVADYVRYRPGYPGDLVQMLREEAGLKPSSVVADIGSGTGISTELFLRFGCVVWAVEPNREMREAAEAQFREQPRFHSIDGTAEATSLEAASVNLIAAGQAFHWFDVARIRTEFARILHPDGIVALFWNSRHLDTTPFLKGYEKLLQDFATDYQQVDHKRIDAAVLKQFFGGDHFQTRTFPNSQHFDFEGLRGRLLSSSYAPAAGHPRHVPMLAELERLFHEYAVGGQVQFDYDTELFFGRVA